MPAYAGARRVFGDENMRDALRWDAGKLSGAVAQRREKIRHRRRRLQRARAVIVALAERDDAPIAEMAVKLEGLERQGRELLGQRGFFLGRDDRVAIGKARRLPWFDGEKLDLVGGGAASCHPR